MLTRGLVGSLLVLLGGLVTTALPASSQILWLDLLVDVRGAEAGRMAGLTLVVLGLGLVAAAWLTLCRQVALAGLQEREGALTPVRQATLVWSAPLLLAPPLFSRDGWSYAAQGMLAHLDRSPYEYGPRVLRGPVGEAVDPMWMDTASPYGPVPLAYGDAISDLTGNPWILVVGHRALALVGLVLLAWAVPRLAAWTGVNPALASAIVIASPLMLANGVGGLHNDLLMVGLMAVALVVAAERGWVVGALVGGLAAAVKAPGGLVCLGVVLVTLPAAATLLERGRRLASVAAVCVAVLVALGVVTGLGLGWVSGLTVPASVNTPLSVTTLVGGAFDWIAAIVSPAVEPGTFLVQVRRLGSAVTVLFLLAVSVAWPTGRRSSALTAVVAVLGVTIVLSPVVHLWYLLWIPPFLATLQLPRLAIGGLLAASVVLGLVAPLDSSLHGAYLAIVLGSMLVAVLLPILLLTPRARERIDRIAASRWLVAP